MSVPYEIRSVKRPEQTVVIDNKVEGPNRYAVRERTGVKYVAGKNPQPTYGRIVGHIVNGEYVAVKEKKLAEDGPSEKSYGAVAFAHNLSDDLLKELLQVYDVKDAYTIMALAVLKITHPQITASRMKTHYLRSFASVFYPGVDLSANTISTFLQKLGQDGEKRKAFYTARAASVIATHHIAIDGTLKQDSSVVNDLSAFSYKARVKGCKDISVLYAYDIEAMEPICAEVFPGNSIDATSYKSFTRDNDIHKGIIVADKGFPPSRILEELKERPNLHFLTPLKRNDVRIQHNKMLEYEGQLTGFNDHILFKKRQIQGGHFLYAFQSFFCV